LKTFSTYDTELCALLVYAGYPLLETRKEALEWKFTLDDHDGGITTLKIQFEAGDLNVSNAQRLVSVHKEILQRIHERTTPKKPEVKEHSGDEEWSVRNVGAAAFLRVSGVKFLRTDRVGYSSTAFVFLDDGTAKTFESDYHAHCSVDAKLFYEALKDIRNATRKASQAQHAGAEREEV
jgi:uncharacterized protein DUF5659